MRQEDVPFPPGHGSDRGESVALDHGYSLRGYAWALYCQGCEAEQKSIIGEDSNA